MQVRLQNHNIKAYLVEAEGAMDAMLAMGWEKQREEKGDVLTLPHDLDLQEKHVLAIQHALDNKDVKELAASEDPKLEALRSALLHIKSQPSLETINKLVKNCFKDPRNLKFRKVTRLREWR